MYQVPKCRYSCFSHALEFHLRMLFPCEYPKNGTSKKKAFSSVKTKTKPNFAVKLAGRSNRSFSNCWINHFFQTSVLFNMWQWNVWNLTDCVKTYEKGQKQPGPYLNGCVYKMQCIVNSIANLA